MNKDGFSLIGCMIYCLILATIMMLWFNGVVSYTRLCTTQAHQINTLSTAYSALDVFARDIRNAPHEFAMWPLITDTTFIFKLDESIYIGWEYAQGQLIRYQGNYSSDHMQWLKRTKSLILDSVQNCSFSFNYLNQDIVSIGTNFILQGKKFNRMAYVRN